MHRNEVVKYLEELNADNLLEESLHRRKALLQGRKGDVDLSGTRIFEREAAHYDAWFDSEQGKILFASELLCLQQLCGGPPAAVARGWRWNGTVR